MTVPYDVVQAGQFTFDDLVVFVIGSPDAVFRPGFLYRQKDLCDEFAFVTGGVNVQYTALVGVLPQLKIMILRPGYGLSLIHI